MPHLLHRLVPQKLRAADSEQGSSERAMRLLHYAENHEARWFWETDAQGRLTYLTRSVADTLGSFGIAALGAQLSDVFVFDQQDIERARSLAFHMVSRTAFSGYAVRGRKGLSDCSWSISGRPWIDDDGTFRGFVGSGEDLTRIRSHDDEIKRLALADSLTGLANRERMQNALRQLLNPSYGECRPIALLLLDLDRFKAVNDTLGHPIGDSLLKQVAKRIVRIVGEAGIVGRLGGDEFEIILPFETSRERIDYLAAAIISGVSQAYEIEDNTITIGCSLGIAMAPEHGTDPETLVRNADLALYSAKESGRASYKYFAGEMLEIAKRRKQLEDDLQTGARQRGIAARLPARREHEDRGMHRLRSLAAVDPPHQGTDQPERFHSDRGRSGADRKPGRLGPAHRHQRPCANARTHPRGDQRLVHPVRQSGLPGQSHPCHCRSADRPRAARTGTDRKRVPGRRRSIQPDVQGAQGDWRAAGARRFRHRLFQRSPI